MKLKNLLFILSFCFALTVSAQDNKIDSLEQKEALISRFVEEIPRYIGCLDISKEKANECNVNKIQEYISTFEYPASYATICFEAKIFISFVVDENGKVTDVTLLKGFEKTLDEAAMEHIRKMPDFAKAGLQMQKPVKVKFHIPFTFKR